MSRLRSARFWRVAALTLVGIVLIKIILAFIIGQQLRGTVRRLREAEPTVESISIYRSQLHAAAKQTQSLRSTLWPAPHAAKAVRHFGQIGGELAAATYSLEAVDEALQAAVALESVYGVIVDEVGRNSTEDDLLNQLTKIAKTEQAGVESAHVSLKAAQTAYDNIGLVRTRQLSNLKSQIETLLSLIEQATIATQALPELLGIDQPHQVLLLLQNADELRATGGFITASAYFTIESGDITEQTVLISTDASIDRFGDKLYEAAPVPMQQYMGLRLWLFRDANWSPDYPTSASKAATLYTYGRERSVDTVIAIDQYTLQKLVSFVGEVRLSDGQMVSADNVIELIHANWLSYRAEDYQLRKAFIADLAPALLKDFLAQLTPTRLPDLVSTMQDIGQSKRLLAYSNQPKLQRVWEATDFDGAVDSETGDYVYPVSANLGYNKVDLNMSRTLNYHASLQDPLNPYGVLSLTYSNLGNATAGICRTGSPAALGTYAQQATDCHVNYVRLYLPDNSKLVSTPSFPVPDSVGRLDGITNVSSFQKRVDEFDKSVFAGLIVTPPQTVQSGEFVYRLSPTSIFQLESAELLKYRLTIPKQPGVSEIKTRVSIDLPVNFQVVDISPPPDSGSEAVVSYELSLTEDFELEIYFEVDQSQLESLERILLVQSPDEDDDTPRIVPTQLPFTAP